MEFGVFDHLDRYPGSLADYYEDRLKITQAYDRSGFYAYHVAEHHATPLGMAPSPSVFLAALAQRTRRLRFGPLVWPMPLHHPLRLIEEICMLDQLSGGRLELGFGRGAAPIELEYYGSDPKDAQEIYAEAVELVIKGLTQKVLDFKGRRFSFSGVPMELEPLQKPHPPIWYGVHATFTCLFRRHGRQQSHPRPPTFDLLVERGQGVAGSPAGVAEWLSSQLKTTGCNYVVGQFAFGDLTLEECLQSIGLFADEVMPLLRSKAAGAAQAAGVARSQRLRSSPAS